VCTCLAPTMRSHRISTGEDETIEVCPEPPRNPGENSMKMNEWLKKPNRVLIKHKLDEEWWDFHLRGCKKEVREDTLRLVREGARYNLEKEAPKEMGETQWSRFDEATQDKILDEMLEELQRANETRWNP